MKNGQYSLRNILIVKPPDAESRELKSHKVDVAIVLPEKSKITIP